MSGTEASRPPFDRNVLRSPAFIGSIFDAIPEAAVVTDKQHRIQLVNRRFEKVYNVSASSVEGTDFRALFQRRDGAASEAACSGIHRSADGREFPVEIMLTEIQDADGHLAGYFYSIRDVSGRKTVEEALRASERQYGSLFEQANDALIIFEPENERILEVNPRACELYGFDHDEFVGRSLQTLTEDVSRGRDAIQDILARGGIRDFESRHFRKDGHPLHLQISCSLIHYDGRLAVLTIIRDISEQKETERALRLAKEAAEEATRMKSDFVAKVSHEIRTPMNGVIGMTELLMETPLNEYQREYAESIARSGESLLNLINDLLDFSKIEAGMLTLEHIPFDPFRLVGEVVELFAHPADDNDTRIGFYVDGDVPSEAIGDPYRIRQILTNLVSNAVKFTDDGEILVTVTAENAANSRTAIVFEVADTGIGIHPGEQERIFEAFTQAEGDTTRRFGGTGLGLTISRQLVRLMEGSIEMNSVHGSGSTFRFSVLVDRGVGTNTHPDEDDLSLEGLRALVVDSSDRFRGIICRHLDEWNVRVREAVTGADALLALNTSPECFDVVLIAQNLSDMDALSFAERLRAAPHQRGPHIVVLTGFMQRSLTEAQAAAGLNACVPAPVRPDRLRLCLTSIQNDGIVDSDSDVPSTVSSADAECGRASVEPSSATILLVEDNLTNQKVASAMLRRYGVEIKIAANGAEALEMVVESAYDLILMDCQMPVMDGFEATRRIRSLAGDRARIPIIALTANAIKGDRERCIEVGMDDYLTKPFRPENIREALDRWLPGRLAA